MKNMLGDFLKKKREAVDLSQGQVAKKLGYTSAQFISNWERGLSGPPLKTLCQLADLYKVSTETLFELILEYSIDHMKKSMRQEYSKMQCRKAK